MAKHIAQFRLPEFKDKLSFTDDGWSNNLLNGPATVLSIYGLPGTEFKITQDSNTHTFIINNTGLFSISSEEYPITNLHLKKTNFDNIVTTGSGHLLTIDYIYFPKGVKE